jgi:5'-deoxynucleotidase YfbR-like HD superfamily hydrolase
MTGARRRGRNPGRDETRLGDQFTFLLEIDRLKSVLRASELVDGSRFENSAEHSWHICMFALVLSDHAGADVDISRVIRMLLLHDIVEVDVGDNPIHGDVDHAKVEIAEAAAARRIFGLLPPGQGDAFRDLWTEFEAAQTPDAIFAKAIDRVAPVFQIMASGGGSWKKYNVTPAQIQARVGAKVARGAPDLWAYTEKLVAQYFRDELGHQIAEP